MLGSWIDLLYRFHPAFTTPLEPVQNPTNPEDLRHQIPRRYELPNDARNQLNPNPIQPVQHPSARGQGPLGRGRGQNNRGFFIKPTTLLDPDPSQAHLYFQPQYSQPFQPRPLRPRGRGRGSAQHQRGAFRGQPNVQQLSQPQHQNFQNFQQFPQNNFQRFPQNDFQNNQQYF
jgi:hypothetical protein